MSGPGPAGRVPPARQQAAEETEAALRALRLLWPGEFMFGHDPERGYWVIKDGNLGSLLTGDTPGELNQALTAREDGGRAS